MRGSKKENTYNMLSHTHNLPINIRVMLGEAFAGMIVISPIIIHLLPKYIIHIRFSYVLNYDVEDYYA